MKHDRIQPLHRGVIIRTVRCPECRGSGYFAGTYGDIECVDCSGEGSWEVEDEEAEQLTEVHGDPLLNKRAA